MNCRKSLLGLMVLLCHLPVFCQQNFFNVPSSDITPKGQVFFQQQVNFSRDTLQSATTFCFGVGHNAEVGFNVIGVTADYDKGLVEEHELKPYFPFYAFNLQKKFGLNEHISVGVGAQLATTRSGRGGGYAYTNGTFHSESTHTKLVGGLYYSTDSYFGTESRGLAEHGAWQKVGVQAGVEQNLWREKVFFQSDFISGKHALGELVLGGAACLNKNWVLSAGYQIPTNHSHSVKALVLEITLVPH